MLKNDIPSGTDMKYFEEEIGAMMDSLDLGLAEDHAGHIEFLCRTLETRDTLFSKIFVDPDNARIIIHGMRVGLANLSETVKSSDYCDWVVNQVKQSVLVGAGHVFRLESIYF